MKDPRPACTTYAEEHLKGRTIVTLRYLSVTSMLRMGWKKSALVIELDDGTLLIPSMDDEGNEAGAILGQKPDGEELCFPVVAHNLMRSDIA